MGLLIFIVITWVIIDIIKECREPTTPGDTWKNVNKKWDSFDLDAEEFQKNLKTNRHYKEYEVLDE